MTPEEYRYLVRRALRQAEREARINASRLNLIAADLERMAHVPDREALRSTVDALRVAADRDSIEGDAFNEALDRFIEETRA